MSDNDLSIDTQHPVLRPAEPATSNQRLAWATRDDDASLVPPIATVTPHGDRLRWASALAGLLVVVLLPVMAGCGSDTGDPPAPTTLAPPTGTSPAGAGVPLEPGSNLPPVEGDDETITTDSD